MTTIQGFAERTTRTLPQEPITYEQFMAWAEEEIHVEWVNGKVVFMSPVSREHSSVKQFLQQMVLAYTSAKKLGEVYDDPFQMKTGPNLPGRAPDVLFVANEQLSRLKENYLDGPADLVIEVISPESRNRDRIEKYQEYEQGGVREYWLIDPIRRSAEFYQLGADGCYQAMEIGRDGRFASRVLPGFWIEVEWLWHRPFPTLLDVIKKWELQ